MCWDVEEDEGGAFVVAVEKVEEDIVLADRFALVEEVEEKGRDEDMWSRSRFD